MFLGKGSGGVVSWMIRRFCCICGCCRVCIFTSLAGDSYE